jgi:hypothetical protein
VLPFGSVMLYYTIDAELSFQPRLITRREYSRCSTVSSAFARTFIEYMAPGCAEQQGCVYSGEDSEQAFDLKEAWLCDT